MYTLGIDPALIVPGNEPPPFAPGALAFNITKTGESRGYMFVKDAGVGASVANSPVIVDATFRFVVCNTGTTAPGAGQGKIVGVTSTAFPIPPNSYAWVQIFGPGLVRAQANVAANAQLNTSVSGTAVDDDGLAGTRVIEGLILTTASGGSLSAGQPCFINWPRIGRTL